MISIDQIRREIGLYQEPDNGLKKEASRSNSFVDPVVKEINEYLSNHTLSRFVDEIEKTANVKIQSEVKNFIQKAEENGVDETQIIRFIMEKKGYSVPYDTNDDARSILHKSANYITELTNKIAVLNDTLELVKIAMDLVQQEHIAPFTSYDELTEKMSELAKEGDPELLKRAAELSKRKIPSLGKVATGKKSVASTAMERYLEALTKINEGE